MAHKGGPRRPQDLLSVRGEGSTGDNDLMQGQAGRASHRSCLDLGPPLRPLDRGAGRRHEYDRRGQDAEDAHDDDEDEEVVVRASGAARTGRAAAEEKKEEIFYVSLFCSFCAQCTL